LQLQRAAISVGDWDVQREIERVRSAVGIWGLALRENFEIYVNANANFSLSKVKFLAFSQYT